MLTTPNNPRSQLTSPLYTLGSVIEKWNLPSLEKSDKRKDLLIERSHFGGSRFSLSTMGEKLLKKLSEVKNKRKSHVLDGTVSITVLKHSA